MKTPLVYNCVYLLSHYELRYSILLQSCVYNIHVHVPVRVYKYVIRSVNVFMLKVPHMVYVRSAPIGIGLCCIHCRIKNYIIVVTST